MIEIRKSPLGVLSSFAEEFSFSFVEAGSPVNWSEISDRWSIKIEYAHHTHKTEMNNFMLRCRISVNNNSSPLPGYVIELVHVTMFRIEDRETLSEIHFRNLKTTSALSIAIQNARALIANFTAANGGIGKYTLPPIDMAHLLSFPNKPVKKAPLPKKSRS